MKIEVKPKTPVKIKNLIWKLLDIFQLIGVPVQDTPRNLEKMAKAAMAVGGIRKSFQDAISETEGVFLRTRDIITFENKYYGESISPGSYDDIRRKDLKLLLESGIVVSSANSNSQAVNNPTRGYALSEKFVDLVHTYGLPEWESKLKEYVANHQSLQEELNRRRNLERVPVTLPNGERLCLSYGEHNNLQKAIIEEFLPRFGFGSSVLYVGDTENKLLFIDERELEDIHFFKLDHEELPDIIAFCKEKNLLYLIEAFHSTGEWNEVRLKRIKDKLIESGCTAIPVFFYSIRNSRSVPQESQGYSLGNRGVDCG